MTPTDSQIIDLMSRGNNQYLRKMSAAFRAADAVQREKLKRLLAPEWKHHVELFNHIRKQTQAEQAS